MVDLEIPPELPSFQVERSDFEKVKGKKSITGGFGKVTFMKCKKTKQKVVEKKTKLTLIDEDIRQSYIREIQILATYHHIAIVPFVGFSIKRQTGYIYLSTMEGGSLLDVIQKAQKGVNDPLWDFTHKLIISYGVAAAMAFLHRNQVLHRDLKPDNVLLDKEYHPYITDFGTAKMASTKSNIRLTITETTPYIMAPEFIENPTETNHSLPIDVFSFGMTLYYMFTGIRPYNTLSEAMQILNAIVDNTRPEIPDYVPQPIQSIITACWSQDPKLRPTFQEALDLLKCPEMYDPTYGLQGELFDKYVAYVSQAEDTSQTPE